MITALTALGALVFTGLSLNATRDQVAIAEQGQFTDRYTKAVEQLGKAGADHLQVRLGALYSLERLAHDSPRDQPTIIEVVSAFVRTTAPRTQKDCPAQLPTADVQAALTILGRRDTTHDNHARVDLNRTCLFGADLRGVDFAGANLFSAHLGQTALMDADLSRANLYQADFSRAILTGAVLRDVQGAESSFFWAGLAEADCSGAVLDEADLSLADLRKANLSRAELRGANLDSAQLIGTNLAQAYLVGAKLTRVYLEDTDFTDATHDDTTVVDAVSEYGTRGKWW
ncbi:pentapeptide repeat-containing protein [Saccharothrix sp. ALI-22-I]|uniref:pentapeptide repeat-containing protein n=1 Tax=Saccharothrix sp. ALI-22-I TaxID=1933778 RepID=UPI0015C2F7D2|nr:pentapeptide repeat-containing protein [Saccharothrix sp. ALI-22-I]